MIENVILVTLALLLVPLLLFAYFASTTKRPGERRRRFIFRRLERITQILVAQKLALSAVVVLIFIARFTGGFPGQQIVALSLYVSLVALAWLVFAVLRSMQKPEEKRLRDGHQGKPDDSGNITE